VTAVAAAMSPILLLIHLLLLVGYETEKKLAI
jgi:hypothetical protein